MQPQAQPIHDELLCLTLQPFRGIPPCLRRITWPSTSVPTKVGTILKLPLKKCDIELVRVCLGDGGRRGQQRGLDGHGATHRLRRKFALGDGVIEEGDALCAYIGPQSGAKGRLVGDILEAVLERSVACPTRSDAVRAEHESENAQREAKRLIALGELVGEHGCLAGCRIAVEVCLLYGCCSCLSTMPHQKLVVMVVDSLKISLPPEPGTAS
jgi:hypothetical protein